MFQPSPTATPDPSYFFQQYLAAPVVIVLYLFWKLYSRDWRLYVPVHEMDLKTGVRLHVPGDDGEVMVRTWANLPMRIVRGLI